MLSHYKLRRNNRSQAFRSDLSHVHTSIFDISGLSNGVKTLQIKTASANTLTKTTALMITSLQAFVLLSNLQRVQHHHDKGCSYHRIHYRRALNPPTFHINITVEYIFRPSNHTTKRRQKKECVDQIRV